MVPLQILTSHSANATVEDEWIRWLQVADHVDIFIEIVVFRRLFRRDRNTKVFQSVTFSLKRLKHWTVCQYTKPLLLSIPLLLGTNLLWAFELYQLLYSRELQCHPLQQMLRFHEGHIHTYTYMVENLHNS